MCYVSFMGDLAQVQSVMPYKGIKLMLISKFLQWTIKKQLWYQGMGRHTLQEVEQIATKDLQALSEYLGKYITSNFLF